MTDVIVTRDTINNLLKREDIRVHVIGRALVALFNRQTESEQAANTTREHNDVGFCGMDGKSGCLTAKYYMKYNTLATWQVERWMKPNRLAKYHRQLNEIALEKKGQ